MNAAALAYVRVAPLPETRAARVALAGVTIANTLSGDQQIDPVYGAAFGDPAVVVFRVLVAHESDAIVLAKDLAEALITAGFDRVDFEPPAPMPGSDGFRCDVAVSVGAR